MKTQNSILPYCLIIVIFVSLLYVTSVTRYLGLEHIHPDRVQAHRLLRDPKKVVFLVDLNSTYVPLIKKGVSFCFLPGTCFEALPPLFPPGPTSPVPDWGSIGTETGMKFVKNC